MAALSLIRHRAVEPSARDEPDQAESNDRQLWFQVFLTCLRENSVVSPVSIEYRLEQHGWASFTLTVDDLHVEVGEFGYCTDALGDLIRAALMVVTGGGFASASFDAEPKEWRILLGTEGSWTSPSDMIPLRVRTFSHSGAGLPESQGVMVFEAEVERDQFARAVLAAAQTVLERLGVDGYAKAWNFTFSRYPLRALHALETALTIEEPTGA